MFKNGLKGYFEDIWNVIDLLPLFTASITMALYIEESYTDIEGPPGDKVNEEAGLLRYLKGGASSGDNSAFSDGGDGALLEQRAVMTDVRVTLQVVTAMLLWYKLLKFLRINKSFAYLIRMIGMVISDMSPFLVVMLVLLIAFADAFYSESNNTCSPDSEEDRCIGSFFAAIVHSYTTALGEFDTYPDWSLIAWALFFICTVFNLIVMLNLLIAIIGATYGVVSNTRDLYATKELCRVIADCRDFDLFARPKPAPCSYLFTAVYEEAETTADKDMYDVHYAVQDVKEQLENI